MNSSTLKWLFAAGSVCTLALIKPPASKRTVVSNRSASVPVAVARPIGSASSLHPVSATSHRFVTAPEHPVDAVIVSPALPPATVPRFLVPDAAPGSAAEGEPMLPLAPPPAFLPASLDTTPVPAAVLSPAAPLSPVREFAPVLLSTTAPPEPTPSPKFVPAGITPPVGPEPEEPSLRPGPALSPASPGLTGLPEVATDGYWIENAPLNEIFQYLARRAEQQYFFNNELSGPEYTVTGHLKLTDPKKQMDDLATAYGLTVHQQGDTIYLMTDAQLAKLPVEVMCYQLKYLRGSQPTPISKSSGSGGSGGSSDLMMGQGDIGSEGSGGGGSGDFSKLLSIIRPLLTKEQGHIEFEEKNNVLLVTDNQPKLRKVREVLEQIDQPKQQIVINVRILRVRKVHGSKIGVDWTNVLGDGLPIRASQSLNAMFGLPDSATLTKTLAATRDVSSAFSSARDIVRGGAAPSDVTTINDTFTDNSTNSSSSESIKDYTDGVGLVFDTLDMEAIVHALKNDDLVTQESCPTIITEDNEQGNVSFVDRFPLITSQVVATASGTNITDEVRYKIDEEDPNAANEPEKSREIGVTLSVTPTLLPDGTVRMRLRPRVANIVDLVTGPSGNVFPRVSESTIEGISRIPKGRSLFLGGFYDSNDSNKENRVPVLGRIPGLEKLFSYKDKSMEQLSLVFIITPRVYDASDASALPVVNREVQWSSGYDRTNPGPPVTPLLPPADPQSGYLPSPRDRYDVPPILPPGMPPPPERRRTWFGRIFSRKPVQSASYEAPHPAPPPPQNPRQSS